MAEKAANATSRFPLAESHGTTTSPSRLLPPIAIPPAARWGLAPASRHGFYCPAIARDPEPVLLQTCLVLIFSARLLGQPPASLLPPLPGACVRFPLRRRSAPAAAGSAQTQRQLGKQLGAKLEWLFK